jgi:hypothetical protein
MKEIVVIVIIVLLTINSFSQINKGNFVVSVDGNYMKTNNETGVSSNMFTTQGKYLSLGGSFGYLITDRFIVGIGFDYNWNKEIRGHYLYFNNSAQAEIMEIKSNVFLPNLFLGYYYCQITNKLYFNANIKLSYGKIKSEIIIVRSLIKDSLIDFDDLYNGNVNGIYDYDRNSKVDYFIAKLCPELTYFIASRFSLYLGLGEIEYSMFDQKSDNSNWTINFNPVYWKLGIKIRI